MQRVTDPSVAPALPAPNSTGNPGYFTDGNPAGGAAATIVTQDWANGVQEELIGLITASGQTPSITTLTPVLQAVQFFGGADLADTGAVNALAVALSPALAALSDIIGMPIRVKIANTTTGAFTLNLNGLGATPVVDQSGNAFTSVTGAGAALAGDIGTFIFNGTAFVYHPTAGRLLNVQKFTASGIYTPTPGTRFIIVEAVGGGASGYYLPAFTNNYGGASGGGGGGFYARALFTSGFTGGIPVTIGQGGLGTTTTAANGGATSFGTLLTVGGGDNSGTYGVSDALPIFGPPGDGSITYSLVGGILILAVQGGSGVWGISSGTGSLGGVGGDSFFGPGANGAADNYPGNNAISPGSGGSGVITSGETTDAQPGGDGANGQVNVWEFS